MRERDRIEIVFDGHVPSKKNSLRRVMVRGRLLSIPSEAYTEWEKNHLAMLTPMARRLEPPYSITAKYWPGRLQKFDMGNAQESIHDLLVKLEIISDDNLFELQSFTCEFMGLSQGAERVEVSVVSLEPTERDRSLHLLRDSDALKAKVAALKAEGHKATQKGLKEQLWAELEHQGAA